MKCCLLADNISQQIPNLISVVFEFVIYFSSNSFFASMYQFLVVKFNFKVNQIKHHHDEFTHLSYAYVTSILGSIFVTFPVLQIEKNL